MMGSKRSVSQLSRNWVPTGSTMKYPKATPAMNSAEAMLIMV
jgi:hypothetical protein